jgi:hypothetical protein
MGQTLGEPRQLRERLPAHVAVIVGGRAVLPRARSSGPALSEVGETIDTVRTVLHNLAGTGR